ncbi:MAG: hypothetical protein CMD65_04380 [Gammaproteobacteria bacterium]|nr:hypothetical protein [Gammaproteobacteria bacterium]|tara:strand:- start:1883 stop:2413 length:531 start_codon:yes stop_codon:yes gene_type:complete
MNIKYIRIFDYNINPYIRCQIFRINDSIIRFRDLHKSNQDELKRFISFTKDTPFTCIVDYPFNKSFEGRYNGIHLKSKFLYKLKSLDNKLKIYSASCHNSEEIELANRLGVNYITISPVKSSKYSKNKNLGWIKFKELSRVANMPAYALGGMNPNKNDYKISLLNGGMGIAGMKFF